MNSMRLFIIGLLSILTIYQGYSQITNSIKIETSFLKYQFNPIQVDPGPNWKGYYLDEEDGIDFNIINDIVFKDKFFAGIGVGYLNFDGINGLSVFSDFEYLPLKTKLTPLINLKIGYSHIWNQYENGTGTGLGEFCVGLNCRLNAKNDIYVKSGLAILQQSLLIPLRLGIRFK